MFNCNAGMARDAREGRAGRRMNVSQVTNRPKKITAGVLAGVLIFTTVGESLAQSNFWSDRQAARGVGPTRGAPGPPHPRRSRALRSPTQRVKNFGGITKSRLERPGRPHGFSGRRRRRSPGGLARRLPRPRNQRKGGPRLFAPGGYHRRGIPRRGRLVGRVSPHRRRYQRHLKTQPGRRA